MINLYVKLPMLGFLACSFLSSVAPAESARADQQRAEGQRPNIVFLISDDHDYDHLGFMGHPARHTPNLDALARSGFLFTHAHLPMSRCHPTLASFLSGRWPHQTGIYYNFGDKRLDPKDSLPRLLRDVGYATYVEGKYWEGDPREMGFTHGKGKTARTFVRKGQDDLLSFIDQQGGQRPLFVWWAPLIPHTPHNPPKKYLKKFDREKIEVPDWITPDHVDAFRKKEHLSLAMEVWLDDGVGELVAKLKQKKLYDNTLFVFVIDNGWCNGLPSKGSPFEKGVRTPVFFTWPGKIAAGKQRDCLISTLDIYPTILDYANAPMPKSAAGISLKPFMEGNEAAPREQLFGAIYPAFATKNDQRPERDVYALYARDERWKYILYVQDVTAKRNRNYFRIQSIETEFPTRSRGAQDLFDLNADPYERKNLAGKPEHAERIARMRQAVLDWWKQTGGRPIDGFAK